MKNRVKVNILVLADGSDEFLPQHFFLEAVVHEEEGGRFAASFRGTEGSIEGAGNSRDEALEDLIGAFKFTILALMRGGREKFHTTMESYGYRCVPYIKPVRQQADDEYLAVFGGEIPSWQLPSLARA